MKNKIILTWQLEKVRCSTLATAIRTLEGQWSNIVVGNDGGIGAGALHRLTGTSPAGQVGQSTFGAAPASRFMLHMGLRLVGLAAT